MEGQVHNDRQNDSAGGADRGALRINWNQCQGSGGEGNNGDDDTCLSHQLGFDFEGKFHYRGERREVGRKKRAQGRLLGRRLSERKEPLDNNDDFMMTTESPWFLVKGKKPTGERSKL
jgi:hypothetical protein